MDTRAQDTNAAGLPRVGTATRAAATAAVRLEDLADTITDDVTDLLYVVAQDLAESGARGADDRHHLARAIGLLRDVAGDLRTIAAQYPDPPR